MAHEPSHTGGSIEAPNDSIGAANGFDCTTTLAVGLVIFDNDNHMFVGYGFVIVIKFVIVIHQTFL